jgi:peptide deformylase
MIKKILQKESPVLRKISESVPLESIGTTKIQTIIKEMKASLASQDDGVAIAAPQIGYSLRIFVVSKKVDSIIKESKRTKKTEGVEEEQEVKDTGVDTVFINPVIKKLSKDKKILEEGCLSVRYLYGEVSRSNKITVEAYDENGKKFTKGVSGLLAQIFQHEIDHLNGILFIDKAKFVEEVLPPHLTQETPKQ